MVISQHPLKGVSSHLSDAFSAENFLSLRRRNLSPAPGIQTSRTPSLKFSLKLVDFVQGVFRQATDPTMVFPMLFASSFYHLGKVSLQGSFSSRPVASGLGRLLTLKALPAAGGFGAETLAFSLSSRSLAHFIRGPVPWDLNSVIQDTAMTSMSLALLKGAGFAGRKIVPWIRGLDEFQPQRWTRADHQALFLATQLSGYLGLVGSHQLQDKIFPHAPSSENIWLDALGAHLALGMGAGGARRLLGSRFHGWEQRLAHRAYHLSQETSFHFPDLPMGGLVLATGTMALSSRKGLDPIVKSPFLAKGGSIGAGKGDLFTTPSAPGDPQGPRELGVAWQGLKRLFDRGYSLDPRTGELKTLDPEAARSLKRQLDRLAEEAMADPSKAQAYDQPAFSQFYYLTHPELPARWKGHLSRFFQGEATALDLLNGIFKESLPLLKTQPKKHWLPTQIVATALLRSLGGEEFVRVEEQLFAEENLRATLLPFLIEQVTNDRRFYKTLEEITMSLRGPFYLMGKLLGATESGKMALDELGQALYFSEEKIPVPRTFGKTAPKALTLQVDPFYYTSLRLLVPGALEKFYQEYARLSSGEKMSPTVEKQQAILLMLLTDKDNKLNPFSAEEINRFRQAMADHILPPRRPKPIDWEQIQGLEKPTHLRIGDLPPSVMWFAKQIRFSDGIRAHLKLGPEETLWDFLEKHIHTIAFGPKLNRTDKGEAGSAWSLIQTVAFATSIADMQLLEFLPVLAHEAYHLFYDTHIARWNWRMKTAKTLHERNAYLFQAEVAKEIIRYLLNNGVQIQKNLHGHVMAEAVAARLTGSSNNKYLGFGLADKTLRNKLPPNLSDEILGIYPKMPNPISHWAHYQRVVKALGEEMELHPDLLQEVFGPLMGPRWKYLLSGKWRHFL